MSDKIRISEIFKSVQGEGDRTGRLSIWIRFFQCNLQCEGFKQQDPTDPSTYVLPYKAINLTNINSLNELPVFSTGCDSAYSWSARYKHLVPEYTVDELVEKIIELLPKNNAGHPSWIHPLTLNKIDLCFTGGEPMLYQQEMIYILERIFARFDYCPTIQIETNGTIPLTESFDHFADFLNVYFNISPKLFNVSGEKSDKAWRPDVISSYLHVGSGYLKFVVNNSDAAWLELNEKVTQLRDTCEFNDPIGVMFVGATKEQQSDPIELKKFADRAVAEGYHISGRLHCTLWGNGIGT